MATGIQADQTLAKIAAMLVSDCTAKGLTLDFSPSSLELIDLIVNGYGVGHADENKGLVELAGAYFGEVLRRNLGGTWYEKVPPDGATGLRMSEGNDVWVWCHAIVHKKLQYGNKVLRDIYREVARTVSRK